MTKKSNIPFPLTRSEMIWEVEMDMANKCYQDELNAKAMNRVFKCRCGSNRPENMTDKELRKWLGL